MENYDQTRTAFLPEKEARMMAEEKEEAQSLNE
jgi:hypothetical protein